MSETGLESDGASDLASVTAVAEVCKAHRAAALLLGMKKQHGDPRRSGENLLELGVGVVSSASRVQSRAHF